MITINSFESSPTQSDIFYVERLLEERSPAGTNTPAVLNSTQLSGAVARETITISSVASPEQQIVTKESDSNEPTIPYGFGNQHPIVPPSRNGLNLPPNSFNVLNNLVVIQPEEEYSPQSPKTSNPFRICKSPMNLSTIEGWETPHTSTDDATFSSKYQPRGVYRDKSSNETFDCQERRQVSITSIPSSTPPSAQRH